MQRTRTIRRKPFRRGSRRSSYARRERDFDWMRDVRKLGCIVRRMPPDPENVTSCTGHVEADHAGARGLGQKSDDRETIGICSQHHRERTDHTGAFKALDRLGARAWKLDAIAATQREVTELRARRAA
jgi:hypothetical protein